MPWKLLAVQLMAMGIGVALGRRITSRIPDIQLESLFQRVPLLHVVTVLGAAVLAAVMALEASDAPCQWLPLLWQRHRAAANWMIASGLFGLAAGFLSAVAVRTGHDQRRLVLACTLAGHAIFAITHVQKYGDVSAWLSVRETPDGIVLQSHPATCTAATLANIARQSGLVLDERGAVRLLGTTSAGTNRGQMRYALERLGIPFRMIDGRTTRLGDVSAPAILCVDHPAVGREGHSVAYMGRVQDRFEIWDPVSGRELWSEADAESCWHGHGIECLRKTSP